LSQRFIEQISPYRNFHWCGNAVETPPILAGVCLSGASGTKLWQRAPASQYLLSRRVLRAAETRGGILPKRGAGSKRKLRVYRPHTPQIIHRFSTSEKFKYFSCITKILARRSEKIVKHAASAARKFFARSAGRRSRGSAKTTAEQRFAAMPVAERLLRARKYATTCDRTA
jgi:hypothetical protein